MGLYVVFWRCADICAIDWPKLTLFLYILRFLFDFGVKMQFYAVFALGFALLWAPAMFFSCIIDSCNKKPCISFFLHLKRRALVFSPCIKIPCIGLRAIYVPALDFQISCKFPCTWILSLCISMQSCTSEITKMALLVFDFSQIIWNRLASCECCSHKNRASKKIIRFYRYFLTCKDNQNRSKSFEIVWNRLKSFQLYKLLYKKAHGHDRIIKSCCSYKTEFIWR